MKGERMLRRIIDHSKGSKSPLMGCDKRNHPRKRGPDEGWGELTYAHIDRPSLERFHDLGRWRWRGLAGNAFGFHIKRLDRFPDGIGLSQYRRQASDRGSQVRVSGGNLSLKLIN